MALDQLSIYNNALLLVGEDQLDSLTEDREARYLLDSSWDLGAVTQCLEVVKPKFASKVVQLNSPAANPLGGLEYIHSLPSNFVQTIDVYSDAELDAPVGRYLQEEETLLTDYSDIYLRYIRDDVDITKWPQSFARLVSAYLAIEIVGRLNPDQAGSVDTTYSRRLQEAAVLTIELEPIQRPKATSGTLTQAWLGIYNDALQLLGEPQITERDVDSARRVALDNAVNSDLVLGILENIAWTWATTSTKITYNTSLSPAWGYQYAFDKPSGMVRFDGIWADEYFNAPIRRYEDQDGKWFCGSTEIYVKYVHESYLTNADAWSGEFRRHVAGKMAWDSISRFPNADAGIVKDQHDDRERKVKSTDAMQSPPKIIGRGSWTQQRTRGSASNQRP